MNLTETEMDKLMASKTQMDWDSVCDEVKDARGGVLPPGLVPASPPLGADVLCNQAADRK